MNKFYSITIRNGKISLSIVRDNVQQIHTFESKQQLKQYASENMPQLQSILGFQVQSFVQYLLMLGAVSQMNDVSITTGTLQELIVNNSEINHENQMIQDGQEIINRIFNS